MSSDYPTPDALWQAVLTELRLQLLRATYDAWLSGSRVVVADSSLDRLVVAVTSPYAPAWLTRLDDLIQKTLTGLTGRPVAVSFVPADSTGAGSRLPLLPSNLSTPLSPQGAAIMTKQSQTPTPTPPAAAGSTRVRIYSYLTKSRFLHIEDALEIGKLRLFAGNYRQGQGTSTYANAFVDIADARVIFDALARGEPNFSHKEYKGTPTGQTAVSRVLAITAKGENVYIELKTGPGKLTSTGAITPHGKAEVEVNVGFKRYEARRMAASVLAYIHAWDVVRMLAHRQIVSQPAPYLLVPATSAANGSQSAPNGAAKANGAAKPPLATAANGRPVTRKDPLPKATSAPAPAAAKRANGHQPARPGMAVPPRMGMARPLTPATRPRCRPTMLIWLRSRCRRSRRRRCWPIIGKWWLRWREAGFNGLGSFAMILRSLHAIVS